MTADPQPSSQQRQYTYCTSFVPLYSPYDYTTTRLVVIIETAGWGRRFCAAASRKYQIHQKQKTNNICHTSSTTGRSLRRRLCNTAALGHISARSELNPQHQDVSTGWVAYLPCHRLRGVERESKRPGEGRRKWRSGSLITHK